MSIYNQILVYITKFYHSSYFCINQDGYFHQINCSLYLITWQKYNFGSSFWKGRSKYIYYLMHSFINNTQAHMPRDNTHNDNPPVTDGFPPSVSKEKLCFSYVNLNKLLNKQSSCQWFQMLWHIHITSHENSINKAYFRYITFPVLSKTGLNCVHF